MFDFSSKRSLNDYEDLNKKLSHLDISILVNNAGLLETDYFLTVPKKNVEDLFYVNMVSLQYLTREFIPRLMQRKSRSGIINVSSTGGMTPLPKFSYYGATKAYVRSLSLALREEVMQNIDVLVCSPGYVETKMIKNMTYKMNVTTAENTIQDTIKSLGVYEECHGGILHTVTAKATKLLGEISQKFQLFVIHFFSRFTST